LSPLSPPSYRVSAGERVALKAVPGEGRAHHWQALTLAHFSAQRKHFVWDTMGTFSVDRRVPRHFGAGRGETHGVVARKGHGHHLPPLPKHVNALLTLARRSIGWRFARGGGGLHRDPGSFDKERRGDEQCRRRGAREAAAPEAVGRGERRHLRWR